MADLDHNSDQFVVDALAAYLGTQEEWNGADCLEVIADLIGTVRPHPGGESDYRPIFRKATGRDVPSAWDMGDRTPEEDEDEDSATYEIVRFRQDGDNEVIETGLTLAEAQEHCKRPDTHGDGWFDGYREE
jgi:hypothetical protein